MISLLKNNNSTLTHLCLSNYIKEDDFEKLDRILQALKENTTVIQLDLSGHPLNVSHLKCLQEKFKNQHNEVYLDLRNTNLGKNELPIVAEILEANPSILYLDLRENDIYNLEVEWIAKSLEKNTHLKSLRISSKTITGESARSFTEKTLKYNHTIMKIDMRTENGENLLDQEEPMYDPIVIDHLFKTQLDDNPIFIHNRCYSTIQEFLSSVQNKIYSSEDYTEKEINHLAVCFNRMLKACELLDEENYRHTEKLRNDVHYTVALFYSHTKQITAMLNHYIDHFLSMHVTIENKPIIDKVSLLLAQTIMGYEDTIKNEEDIKTRRKIIILLLHNNNDNHAKDLFTMYFYALKNKESTVFYRKSHEVSADTSITDNDVAKVLELPTNFTLRNELQWLLLTFIKQLCLYEAAHEITPVNSSKDNVEPMDIDSAPITRKRPLPSANNLSEDIGEPLQKKQKTKETRQNKIVCHFFNFRTSPTQFLPQKNSSSTINRDEEKKANLCNKQ